MTQECFLANSLITRAWELGGTGLEPVASCVSSRQHPPDNNLKNKDLQNPPQGRCTKRRTQEPEKGQKTINNQAHQLPADLAEIVAVWPDLPEHIKAAIKTLVEAHKGKEWRKEG